MSNRTLISLDDPVYYLSIDGGTSTVGLCYYTVEDGVMVVENTRLIDVGRVDHLYDDIEDRHGSLSARLRRIKIEFKDYTDRLPHPVRLIGYESHFINARRPTSVIPLVRFMQIVDDFCIDEGIELETVAPQQMKKAIQVSGKLSKADKDKVYLAIKRLVVDGKIKIYPILDELSEHEIDAIGIGYTLLKLQGLLR